jgi:hypothetical protein
MKSYAPLPLVVFLLALTILAAGFAVDLVGVRTFPWTLLVFGVTAAALGYLVARVFRLGSVDLRMLVAVGIVVCVFALPPAIYYAAAALVG